MNQIVVTFLFFFLLLPLPRINAIDNPHFYRANFLWDEPRLQMPFLGSLFCTYAEGSTMHARNSAGHTTSLLNLYGLQNMQALGKHVPFLNPANPLEALVLDVAQTPARDTFGKLLLEGSFDTSEIVLNMYQNIVQGFFLQLYAPLRHVAVSRIKFIDQSPTDTVFPNKNSPIWVNFLSNLDAIFAHFGLTTSSYKRTGPGDITFLGGWTCNYQDTTFLDFIDVTAKIGILFPTGLTSSLSHPLAMPLGYNGHYGVPLKFALALGYWEWLTVGMHMGALFLIEKKRTLALKTDAEQNGFFSLTAGQAKIDPGIVWEVSTYIKADHLCRGLSLLGGYCYTRKDRDIIRPENRTLFPEPIVNQDPLFRHWDMHVLHVILEYDFAQTAEDLGVHVQAFYNRIVAGKRIFNTNMAGAQLGLQVVWCFT